MGHESIYLTLLGAVSGLFNCPAVFSLCSYTVAQASSHDRCHVVIHIDHYKTADCTV